MAKELFYLFSLLCAVVTSLHAEPAESISFVHIGLDDGLSQSTVFDITQDERGNMWFATYNGLNKYDGYDFTVYQHDEKNENSIGGDIIRCTMQIWIPFIIFRTRRTAKKCLSTKLLKSMRNYC